MLKCLLQKFLKRVWKLICLIALQCVSLDFYRNIYIENGYLFPEDDDGDELFITQCLQDSNNKEESGESVQKSPVLGDDENFQSQIVLLDNKYSDISDDNFEIISSQKRNHSEMEKER